jgi:hypothetical protein
VGDGDSCSDGGKGNEMSGRRAAWIVAGRGDGKREQRGRRIGEETWREGTR